MEVDTAVFGSNKEGELGLNHNDVSLPTPIPHLSQKNLISCGDYFSGCVDYEGFIWSFGQNSSGQLGTGNKTNFNIPQKIEDIPPVLSVSCGHAHTLITETRKIAQNLNKHHFRTSLKYQLVILIHYFKITKEKYLHVEMIKKDNVDWVFCGFNNGQLCLGNRETQMKPQKTSFSNISAISAGWSHSLVQNNKEKR